MEPRAAGRNPGQLRRKEGPIPDFASLHPGYKRCTASATSIRRRAFIALLGTAAAWPLAARAQRSDRMRRIGVLAQGAANDAETAARLTAFVQGLQELGWSVGRNARIEYRWADGDATLARKYAAELVALGPDVILAAGGNGIRPLLDLTSTIPIVFDALDPVAGGFVDSLARPGGNATGFTQFELAMSGKWLELLKQIAPGVKRVAVVRDPTNTASTGQFSAIQAVAPPLGVEINPIDVRNAGAIERGVSTFVRAPNGGLIVAASPPSDVHRNLIITLAARHRLPAGYPFRYYVADGGLISYGPDRLDSYHRAAGYVDRILKGERPADLPVQAPTKYELVINLKTAKALGLDVPPTLLARTDEVIE
jgi:putative ABC transport system substrate-binding protein